MRCVELRGRDHEDLGELTAARIPGVGALALSRGLYPKPYAYVDPNEDGALLYADEAGRLLAVVDGHTGRFASECTLDHVREAAPDLLRSAGRDAFEARVRELVRALSSALRAGGPSRSCLVLASLVGRRCRFACFGDSSLMRAGSKELVSVANDLVLGPEVGVRLLPPELWLGDFEGEPGERVALVSDGVTNFHPDPEHLTRSLGEEPDDLAAARSLAEAALQGGAGDNVAVVSATL